MLIVGERINTSRKAVNEAVAKRDSDYIRNDVKSQIKCGADLIDVNAGSRRDSEVDDLIWLIDVIQEALPEARLCIDSPNPGSIKAVIEKVNHTPMINSTTAEKARFEAMAPIIESRESDIVALCIDDRGIPKNSHQGLENAERLITDLESLGVKRDRIYIDPVIQAISTNQNAALMVFEIIEGVLRDFTGVNIVCGLSNISFGLPKRKLVNRTFMTLAINAGLNSAIIDPLDKELMGTLRAAELLMGNDQYCQRFITAFREGKL